MVTDLEIKGTVYKPGDDAYEQSRSRNFAVNAHSREDTFPALIAQVSSVGDIQACLAYAKEHKLSVNVRSGGHNWFGCFLRQDSLLIDMKDFTSLEIDAASKTATVGPCVLGQTLAQEAAKHGLCFPTGHCVGVPVGGFLLGGGYGWFTDYFGMAAESLEAITLVTPQGQVVEASCDDDAWLWLARGAASAFPGVAVSFKIKLHPLPPIVRNISRIYPVEDFEKICSYVLSCRADNSFPRKVEATVVLSPTPPPLAEAVAHPKICMFFVACMADSEEEFGMYLDAVDKIPSTPYFPADFADYSFSSLSDTLAPAYPPGFHWDTGAYVLASDAKVDWASLREVFETKASPGLATIMCVFGVKTSMKKPGAYGETNPGTVILNDCGYTPEGKEAVQHFRSAVDQVLEPIMERFNPLEHRLNETTFAKSFVDSEKILRLRNVYDPEKIFFDPSKAKP